MAKTLEELEKDNDELLKKMNAIIEAQQAKDAAAQKAVDDAKKAADEARRKADEQNVASRADLDAIRLEFSEKDKTRDAAFKKARLEMGVKLEASKNGIKKESYTSLFDGSKIAFDESGEPVGVAEAFKVFKDANPELFGSVEPEPSFGGTGHRPPKQGSAEAKTFVDEQVARAETKRASALPTGFPAK